MSNTKNTIVINGRTYDSRTGAVLDSVAQTPAVQASTQAAPHHVFQDVVGPIVIKPTNPVRHPKPAKRAQKPARSHHATTAHKVHAHQQRAETLKRSAVQKPLTAKPSTAKQPLYDTVQTIKPKKRVVQPNHAIVERAKNIPQSKLISKFNHSPHPTIVKSTKPLEVKKLPIAQPKSQTHTVPHSPKRVHKEPRSVNRSDDLFMAAIANATSHQEPKLPKTRHHKHRRRIGRFAVGLGASLIVVALLGVFFSIYAKPRLAFRTASSQAGIAAQSPHFSPSGFTMRSTTSPAKGKLVINFSSKKGDTYSITQESSAFDNEALRSDVATTAQQDYQTYESNGKTIYLYNNSTATWVSNGIRFTIDGNSSLSSDQVLRVAASF